MFGAAINPVNAYKSVGIETSVQSASPHRLIVLLFEGAAQAIVDARAGMAAKDIARKGLSISKAIDIILNGLRASLNREEGGELAENLYALYDYMARRLLHANMHNDAAALEEVQKLLGEIHEAWLAIANKVEPQAATANASRP
ncbi:flagellar export chaperone FliS [Rhodocyclus tenuis]|uniref:Flagellar secretion chaperone FliS n=2 Tax=Rhodocyclus TaxID=1064 RepID=A0A6L5JW20_RHOTE|nr:flagellar export chaperone FliS [Rhodocyclus gracilis]MQY51577.1 flagellar export chaperone FliS [Rhodocyclus gracilis]MRD73059.1 flagellar export chaperone FliS [Rhodocyclus gracilis]NJA89163.1 flagellar export chaperone FliS [Rhodocyclus gracilis]